MQVLKLTVLISFIASFILPCTLQAANGAESPLASSQTQKTNAYGFWENTNSLHDLPVNGSLPEVEVTAEPLDTEQEASPDSVSWDPVRYMRVPFTVRRKHAMGWSPADIDARDLFFDQLHDVTDSIPADMLNNVSSLLSAGNLSDAKAVLEAHFGSEVEILKA